MGEILGIGATHYPPGLVPDEYKPWPLARMLHIDARIPSHEGSGQLARGDADGIRRR